MFHVRIFQSVSLPVHLFLLVKKIKIQLRYLKLADITVGIEAGCELNVIFHSGIYCLLYVCRPGMVESKGKNFCNDGPAIVGGFRRRIKKGVGKGRKQAGMRFS